MRIPFPIFGKWILMKYFFQTSESAYILPQKNTGDLIRFFAPIVTRRGGRGRGHFCPRDDGAAFPP